MRENAFIFLLYGILLTSCTPANQIADHDKIIFNQNLAYRWAPIHYQDTDDSNPIADYITKFDYDGNYIADDNWDHLATGYLSAYAYYSVVETATHWFITYMFYHPRDWDDGSFDQEHENDMEGLLVVIKKGQESYGSFVAMLTAAHGGIYSYVPEGSALTRNLEVFNENVPNGNGFNGIVKFQTYDGRLHIKTSQHAKGHGLYAFPSGDFSGLNGQDGIIYYPSKTISEFPSSPSDDNVKYKLINVFDLNLWSLQLFESGDSLTRKTYFQWGVFKGNKTGGCGRGVSQLCAENSAMAPWYWDVGKKYQNYRGLLAMDPASLIKDYFNGLGNFSLVYSNNRFLQDLKDQGFTNENKPYGWPPELVLSQLYQKLSQ